MAPRSYSYRSAKSLSWKPVASDGLRSCARPTFAARFIRVSRDPPERLDEALTEGLDLNRAQSACKHVALAETPGIAAGVLLPVVDGAPTLGEGLAGPVVVAVDVSGLDLFFELGEARYHGAPIDPIRIQVLDPQPSVDMTGWSDPAWRRNHSHCIALRGYPLARQLLNAASSELAVRYPYDAFDDERFRQIVEELTPC